MALLLEIDHLLGVAFAAIGPDRPDPEWPPQPDRVFSALVAAWAARGERPEERAALEWLERQDPPRIHASGFSPRPAAQSFVPPNDRLTITANPYWRTRQPRRFPAALPHDPLVRLVWAEADGAPLTELDALARAVACIGHSASLTRCRFLTGPVPPGRLQPARRRIYAGRLAQLQARYLAGRRPFPGEPLPPASGQPAGARPAGGHFSPDWLVLEITDGALDLRATALAAKELLKAVMKGYGDSGQVVPEWVSGHRLDATPSQAPHLAVVPLAFVGYPHADGRLLGLALVPPAGRGPLLDDDGLRRALFRISEAKGGRRHITLGHMGLTLAIALETERVSLNPVRYGQAGTVWATATPLILPRHLRTDTVAEVEEQIRHACEQSGLPRPDRVVVHKHSAITGAPAARRGARAPVWTGWTVPKAFSTRTLTHAVILFKEPVHGPVLIGAGRYCGLGLCLPLEGPTDAGSEQ